MLVAAPVKNNLHLTQDFIASAREQQGDHELWILDNGSDDGTAEWLAAQHDVQVMDCPGASLYEMWNTILVLAAARNLHPLICNNDITFDQGNVVKAIEDVLNAAPKVWVCTPNDGYYKGLGPVKVPPFAQDKGGPLGYCFGMRVTGLKFDEGYDLWYGDTDMWCQVWDEGKDLVILQGLTVTHFDGGSQTLDLIDAEEKQAKIAADGRRFSENWSAWFDKQDDLRKMYVDVSYSAPTG